MRIWINILWLSALICLAAASAALATEARQPSENMPVAAGRVPVSLVQAGQASASSATPTTRLAQADTQKPATLPTKALPRIRNVTLIPAKGVLGIYWQPPSSGIAQAPASYQIEVNGRVQDNSSAQTSLYLDGLTNQTYAVRVRAVMADGTTGGWSDLHKTDVTVDLPAPMASTLSDTVTFSGVTLTLDRPMPIAQTVDGRPVILSGGQDFAITNVSPPSGVQPGGNTIGNGLMRDPSWFRDGRKQGYEQLIAQGKDKTTRVPYVPEMNLDPAVSGPLQIKRGAATSLVKSIRRDQTDRPWADRANQQWAIGEYAVFSVMPHPLPEDSFRPAITPLNKVRNLKFARNLDLSVLRNLPLPPGETLNNDTVLANTALDQAFYGTDNGEIQNSFGPDDNYSTQWQDRRKLAWVALHSDVLTPDQKRTLSYIMITHALDLEAIIDAGWKGRQGAGQGLGFIPYLYFGGFLLQDRGLLEKARATASSELGLVRHGYVPDWKVGKSGAYPDKNKQYNAPFLPAHVGTAHIYGDAAGSAIDARYSSLIQDGSALPTLSMILLQNGPGGISGIEAITGNSDLIGPDNPTSAPIATLDAYHATQTRNDARHYYDAWRDVAGPRYTEAPKQPPKLGTDAEFAPIRNGVSWDWTKQRDGVSGTYASSDIRYSLDQRTWTEVTGQKEKGWLTGLMAGQTYYMGIRHVDTQGRKGIYSGNLGGIGPEVYTVTPTGGSAAAAPVSKRAPAATYRPYLEALMPHFEILPEGEVIPREAVDIYPSIGDWSGSPAPTYRWKIRRNGTDITPYQPFTSDYGNNWAGVSKYTRTQADFSGQPKDTWLEVVIEASNDNGTTEAVSPRIYMPQRAVQPANTLIDTGFTDAMRVDYPEVWNNLIFTNGSILLSNGFYNHLAATPGYIFNSKDGSSATLRVRMQEVGQEGARYRINAQIIIGTAGRTRASIRAGDTISEIATYPAKQSPKIVTIKDYIHTVPATADGEKLNFDLFLSNAGGIRGGAGLGIISLKIERL